MRRRPTALVLGVGLVFAAAVALYQSAGSRGSHRAPYISLTGAFAAAAKALPRPERPAFTVGRPVRLHRGAAVARIAPVTRAALGRSGPSRGAAVVAELTRSTQEGTTNVVLVLAQTRRTHEDWVHIRLPILPNNRTAWVPRRVLGGYEFVHTRLVVDKKRFTATLLSDGRAVFRARVGVGRPESPTPSGEFYIRDKLSGFGNPFYGPVAYGTSARSAVLTDWPGGGFVGLHGTNEPALIPGRISHGCIRMRNEDIVRLSRLMPVGTPLTIR
jgi:lipoprotein-anchoring transpeptidase ErfK/SrfK